MYESFLAGQVIFKKLGFASSVDFTMQIRNDKKKMHF